MTVDEAAPILGLTANALRDRLRRAQRRVDGRIIADVGLAVGVRLGSRSWRVMLIDLASSRP
jgi:hypothetical protein